MPIQAWLLRFQFMFLSSLPLCLYLCFPSMADLGTSATGEDVECDGLNGDIERHVGQEEV